MSLKKEKPGDDLEAFFEKRRNQIWKKPAFVKELLSPNLKYTDGNNEVMLYDDDYQFVMQMKDFFANKDHAEVYFAYHDFEKMRKESDAHVENLDFSKNPKNEEKDAFDRLIHMCVLSGFTVEEGHVDLMSLSSVDNTIREIPESIKNLKYLRGLSLFAFHKDYHNLFPSYFSELQNLKFIDAEDILGFMDIQPLLNLNKLESLRCLGQPGSKDLTILFENFSVNNKLKKIIFLGTSLKQIPDSIEQCRNLEELTISISNLSELPITIGNLPRLREIEISESKLQTIPDSIGNLELLRIANFADNAIKEIPENICNCERLEELCLSANQITTIPTAIGKLKGLIKLDISKNVLKDIPKEIGHLNNLKEFNLSENQLVEIPDDLENLHKIEILNLQHNKLEGLSSKIGRLRSLRELYLGYNKLRDFEFDFGQLSLLERLEIRGNPLTSEKIESILEIKKDRPELIIL